MGFKKFIFTNTKSLNNRFKVRLTDKQNRWWSEMVGIVEYPESRWLAVSSTFMFSFHM